MRRSAGNPPDRVDLQIISKITYLGMKKVFGLDIKLYISWPLCAQFGVSDCVNV